MDLSLFEVNPDAEPKDLNWTECEVCGLGCLIERGSSQDVQWHEKHECPPPYPQEVAQSMWNTLVVPNSAPMHPRTKARLQMSWRAGFIKERP